MFSILQDSIKSACNSIVKDGTGRLMNRNIDAGSFEIEQDTKKTALQGQRREPTALRSAIGGRNSTKGEVEVFIINIYFEKW